jgi:hypothetical protein
MTDLLLQYRACGAECRDDYLRQVAHDNGLPLACVRRIADRLGEREDFGALVLICETQPVSGRGGMSDVATDGQFRDAFGHSARKNFCYLNRYLR